MILEFKIKNYRSYKEEVSFSMLAEASKLKSQNIFEEEIGNQQIVRTLKTAVIYGANASGKTNLIKALYSLINFIRFKPKVEEQIKLYDPFILDKLYLREPSEFELTFIGPRGFKYIYSIKITGAVVMEEELNYYPNNRITNLFKREPFNINKKVQTGILGNSKSKREISVFGNQLLISKFGDDEPDELLSDVFLHFENYYVMNATNPAHKDTLHNIVSKELYENRELQFKLGLLIQAIDAKVYGIKLDLLDEESLSHLNPEIKAAISKDPYVVYFLHYLYHGNVRTNETTGINIQNESKGSQTLYVLGGKILSTIEKGGVLVVDELDTSLHPFITKLIVMLFQSNQINKKGAQLIFTTHDVSLLDRDLIRKDQVWFAEKNDQGITDLYSLQDFDGLREDAPFEKWYMAGKFGGLPNIKSLESIFENVATN